MLRILVLLAFLPVLTAGACGPSAGDAYPPLQGRSGAAGERDGSLQLVPEWDSVTAVVVSVSQAFASEALARTGGPGARALLEERLRFYRTIAGSSPDTELMMLVDEPRHVAAARQAMGDPANLTVIARPSWVWTRDFAPLSGTLEGGARALVGFTPFMSEVSRAIADHAGLPLLEGAGDVAPTIEGGDFLVDGQGRCYLAARSPDGEPDRTSAAKIRDLETICRDVRTVSGMPHEKTGHIDVFALLLDDSASLVAEYATEDFHLAAEPAEHRFHCTDPQIRNEAWQDCDLVRTVYPDRSVMVRDTADSEYGRPLTVGWADVIPVLGDSYPETDFVLTMTPDAGSRREHVDQVATALSDYGFRVMRLESPTPVLSLDRLDYRDGDGRTVRKIVRVQAVFPTYTNALLVNGVAYVPWYATASAAQNAGARALYEEAGYRVVPVDMTQSIHLHGAARCLSQQLHGR